MSWILHYSGLASKSGRPPIWKSEMGIVTQEVIAFF
jgi:hypothetical protein